MSISAALRVCVWITLGVCGFGGSRKDVSAVLHGGLPSQGFSRSVSDANLMYEILLGGIVIDTDDNIALRDQELASMRQGRAFISFFNDYVPKTLFAMEQLLATLEGQGKPLGSTRFETLILGTVYSAYQVRQQEQEEAQVAWSGVLARLANVTLIDLRMENAPN
ncbi:hypothetical protein MATL_G00097900 [Megalops atlanticus]|uniref:Uncharacterized protein n=1 Tax=Megalops atlanticus TaxID=7932 RepID=A0A9D3Q6P6_MEGAT|nr:hypothetical protein MATL_G00097900 [Megalops atlanticus]